MINKNGKNIIDVIRDGKIIEKIVRDSKIFYEKSKEKIRELLLAPPFSFNSTGESLINYEVFGNTKQNTTTGKNIFGFGINVVDKTNEYRTNIYQRVKITGFDNDKNKIKCNYTNGSYSVGYLQIDNIDGTLDYKISYKVVENTTNYTVKIVKDNTRSDSTKLVLSVNGENGANTVTSDNYFIFENIQVEIGSNVTPFEPYTGGIASPNPNYPQEMESVGDFTGQFFDNSTLGNNDEFGTTQRGKVVFKTSLILQPNTNYTFETNLDLENYDYYVVVSDSAYPIPKSSTPYIKTDWMAEKKFDFTTNDTAINLNIVFARKSKTSLIGVAAIKPFQHMVYEKNKKYKIPLEVKSENLYDKSTQEIKNVYIDSYTLTSPDGTSTKTNSTDFIEVTDGKYIISSENPNPSATGDRGIKLYNENKEPIKAIVYNSGNIEDMVEVNVSNAKYIRFSYDKNATNVKIVKEEILEIYLDEPLRKIGDYVDYVDFEEQKVHRVINEIALDGSEDWQKVRDTLYNVDNLPKLNARYGNKINGNVKSSNYLDGYTAQSNDEFLSVNATLDYCFNIHANDTSIRFKDIRGLTTEGFKTWLSQNNVTVDYILANEIIEDIELPEISTTNGDNTLDVKTITLPSNVYIKYKSNN